MSPFNLVGQLRSMNEKLMTSVGLSVISAGGVMCRGLGDSHVTSLGTEQRQLWLKALFYEVPLPATLSSKGPALGEESKTALLAFS